jgi:hypothetical protein
MRDGGRELGVYQDDTSNYAHDFHRHLVVQQEQYQLMLNNSLTFKASKAHLNYKTQHNLGHMMSKHGRTLDPKIVESITLLAPPKTLTHLQSVLGLAQHARKYIASMSTLLEPMQRLCKKGVDIEASWGPQQEASFAALKGFLTSSPVLVIPDLHRPFRVHVDTCKVERGVRAVLLQRDELMWERDEREHWRPVAYWSRSLSDAERNYSATELECTGLHDAIMHWSVYLQNCYVFDAIVDHYALVYMITRMSDSLQNQRLLRLCLDLQNFAFRVVHRKVKDHWDAYAISRLMQIDEVVRVNTIDALRTEEAQSEYQVLLERMARVIETQDTVHAQQVQQAWMEEKEYRNVMKIATSLTVPINAVRITAPSLASQVSGQDIDEPNAAVYGLCRVCAGDDLQCEVCRWVSVWASRYARQINEDRELLIGHMIGSIRAAELMSSDPTAKSAVRMLRTLPEAVLCIVASSAKVPLVIRQRADQEIMQRQGRKQQCDSLGCMPSLQVRRQLLQGDEIGDAVRQGVMRDELQRREVRACACSVARCQVASNVNILATATRQAGREQQGDAITRSGCTHESGVFLNLGGLRERRLDLERKQEEAAKHERQRVRDARR